MKTRGGGRLLSATRLPHLQSLTHHPGPAAAPPPAPPSELGEQYQTRGGQLFTSPPQGTFGPSRTILPPAAAPLPPPPQLRPLRDPGVMRPPSRWLPPPPPLPPLPPLLRQQPPPPRPQPKSPPSPLLRHTLTLLMLVLLGVPSQSYAAKGDPSGTAPLTSTAAPLQSERPAPTPHAESKLNGFVQRAAGLGGDIVIAPPIVTYTPTQVLTSQHPSFITPPLPAAHVIARVKLN